MSEQKPERVYLVATGEIVDGRETYTRHDARPPMCDFETLYAAPPAQPARQLVSVSSIDIERMITECLPGGHSCDPQQVADAIRQFCNAAQPAQAQPARLSDGDIARHWFATTEEDEIWPSVVKFARTIEAAVVPPGHVVVPVKPTAKMLANLMRSSWDVTHGDIELTENEVLGLYRAMIAAAKATK